MPILGEKECKKWGVFQDHYPIFLCVFYKSYSTIFILKRRTKMTDHTLIFGHRGAPVKFPENSLVGFKYALAQEIDGIEFDVHLSKDQIPVVIHDETL